MQDVTLTMQDATQVKRRAYLWTALFCALTMLTIGLYDLHAHQGTKSVGSFMGAILSLLSALWLARRRLNLRVFEVGVAVFAFLGAMIEVTNVIHLNHVDARPVLTFVFMASVWYGMFPIRRAALMVAVAFVGFAGLFLTRAQYDLGVLIYLGFVTTLMGILTVFGRQISQEREASANHLQQAMTDALTGLPNRRALMAELENPAVGNERTFALFMLDVDHFKNVNDRYGHMTGDEVLRRIAERLSEVLLGLPAQGMLARWGGEEFMLLLKDTDATQAYDLTASLGGRVFPLGTGRTGAELPSVTFSVGAALSHEASTLDELLHLVDRRLHVAKQSGRNQVKWDEHFRVDASGA